MSDLKQKVIQALESKGARLPCSRCGHAKFSLLDDFARIDVQRDFRSISLGGTAIPCVMVACTNCGDVNFHALGALGLLDAVKEVPQAPAEKGESNG